MAWFITVEGGDGAGKSTLISKIEAWLRSHGQAFQSTREPGGSPVCDEIRDVLLKPGRTIHPMTELLLYEASRAEHVHAVIRPALAKGISVLCDRFTDSTFAYQGAGRSLGTKLVHELNQTATGGLIPDATIWLRIDPVMAAQRRTKRGDENRMDREAAGFHAIVFKAFETLAKAEAERFIVLDASHAPDEIFAELQAHPTWQKLMAKNAKGASR